LDLFGGQGARYEELVAYNRRIRQQFEKSKLAG
jgi:hypothetical protein